MSVKGGLSLSGAKETKLGDKILKVKKHSELTPRLRHPTRQSREAQVGSEWKKEKNGESGVQV